ncbi:MAG: acetylornithine/succinylornithine family transaminase [Pseudomonadota bacterium]
MPDYLIALYNKLPTTFVRGENIWLYDENDRAYLDAITGIGVNALGHQHPEINRVMIEQIHKIVHTPNTFNNPAQNQLAEKLCKLTGLSRACFSNSGTEANEAAIKLALKYGINKGYKNPKIVVMHGGFHGRSLGAWSASCNPQQSIFGPLLPAFIYVPFNSIEAIEILNDPEIIGVMLEPIFGKGGLLPASVDYLQQLKKLCVERDWLLICDEVQSGLGRTGKWFAYQFADIVPDIVTVAKCLGNGIPIGACIVSEKLVNTFQINDHGTTQGGGVFACTTALAVLNVIEKENLIKNAHAVGTYLQEKLNIELKKFSCFEKIRGKGLMIGIQLTRTIPNAISIGVKHGIIFNNTGKDVIRLLPPIILTYAQADILVERLVECFQEF